MCYFLFNYVIKYFFIFVVNAYGFYILIYYRKKIEPNKLFNPYYI
ncbi:hypothetical protein XBKQ1_2890002 [Xenorhabdus bovienii str. kraussei Quebec]|uniref:Uncharacterized protein n=2 Tax=Xenorhabdus bovienii TaxID=40576 RepID=A0A077PJY6_XENBV|nr:hypothetical protein XBKQ1_2890002 [Xenorhabdus bovienii str. kraussei Quebec]CDH31414.1 hypothetical protein XBI1_1450025 [Xenorhabdus bovienii str. Intermedium]